MTDTRALDLRARDELLPMASPAGRARGWDALAVVCGAALVVSAALEGRRLVAAGVNIFLAFPPLLASWLPHLGPGTLPSVCTGVAVAVWGPALADRLSWRALLLAGWAAASAWTLSLALVDGWAIGVAGRLTSDQEYLYDLPKAPSIAGMLAEFTARLPVDQPVHWGTHVGGHPPGAFLVFLLLDRVGLAGGAAAGLFCVLVGSSAVAAMAVTLRALGAEPAARRVLPFSVLLPGAVWVGVSADGMFAGVLAWAAALLALGATGRGIRADLAAFGAGLLFGYTLYLSYGLVLGGCVLLAVVVVTRRARAVLLGSVGVGVVAAGFTVAGFWWPAGFEIVRMLYAGSIAKSRPYEYFWWANLAALLVVIGPAVLVGLRRALRHPRAGHPAAVALTAAGLAAVLAADLSGLSKGEVERIWLPFAVWLVVATGWLPPGGRRAWLAGQVGLTLLTNHLLLTVW